MSVAALLLDFDGVLIESEYAGNRHLAEYLTGIGHPITPETAMTKFMGLAGPDFIGAIENWIGRVLPDDFQAAREAEDRRVIASGIEAVRGAIAFVRALPADLPRAICSSSRTEWIDAHLRHIGLQDAFGPHIYSGREHVTNGKPAPDIYLHAAAQLGVPIKACLIVEDSPVGATAAVASGAEVVGLCVASHIGAGHEERLREIGVQHIAHDFDEVDRLLA